MKIAVLTGGRLGLPAIQRLIEQGRVSAIGLPANSEEAIRMCKPLAERHNIPVRIFTKKNLESQLNELQHTYAPAAVLVLTFPFRIPAAALTLPPHGFINIHYGLLPEMRGADPIFESIRMRRSHAGVTAHVMDADFDTGPIIMREEIQLPSHFTYGMLSAQLAYKGAEMCEQIVQKLEINGSLKSTPQDESKANYYGKMQARGIQLHWQSMDSSELLALINACNPASKTGVPAMVNGWTIGICCAAPIALSGDVSSYSPGDILVADAQNGLLVLAKDGIALKLEVVYTEEGYFPGYVLSVFGIGPGMRFTDGTN